jgi:glycosyltransferase EpsJ
MSIGLEYAPGNPASQRQKRAHVRSFVESPEMRRAISWPTPAGLARNKQLVVDLVRRRWFVPLGLLYTLRSWARRTF